MNPAQQVYLNELDRQGRFHKRGCLLTFVGWLAALGTMFWISRKAPLEQEQWQGLYVTASVAIIFITPAAGILFALDLKSYLDWKNGRSGGTSCFRGLIFLGCWLAALVTGATGLLSLMAVLENGSSREGWKTAVAFIFSLGICWLAIVLARLPFRRAQHPTEAQFVEEANKYEEQMKNPDFASLEERTQQVLPQLYKDLFAPESRWPDNEWVLTRPESPDEEEFYIVALQPAHVDSLRQHSALPGDFLAFAVGTSEEFWIRLGDPDPAVFVHDPDSVLPRSEEEICARLSEFLKWAKEMD